MTHYICTGECNGVSEEPGTCQATECSKHGEPLVACECVDEQHHEHVGAEESDDEA